MQGSQGHLDAKSPKELEKLLGAAKVREERAELAHMFRFLSQGNNPYVRRKAKFEDVKYRSFYSAHKADFDKLHFILAKYNVDRDEFLRFALNRTNVYTPGLLLNANLFKEFANHRAGEARYADIYRNYMKSVGNVAKMCVDGNMTPRNLLSSVFHENRMAYEYVSGRISKYYIASIQNFREIYPELDSLNRDELRIIYDAADELRTMADEAMVKMAGRHAKPVSDAEAAVVELTNKTTN